MGRKINQACLLFVFLPVHFACAPQAAAPQGAQSPEQASTNKGLESGETNAAHHAPPSRADLLYPAHIAVPAPPDSCTASSPLPAPSPCTDARGKLASALVLTRPEQDAALVPLEACSEFEPGLIRALRVDLGPAECADVLVDAVVSDTQKTTPQALSLSPVMRETLVGQGLAARLRRLATTPPEAPTSRKKEELDVYYKDVLSPWIDTQASAIYAMASQGKALHGYARGLVAIEAGNADMRFVEIARAAPIAEEIQEYPEARDLYYATLDERLEPRKGRGSAAALVGLREMAHLGIRENERVASARKLLSVAFGGRRINALDTLLLPPLPPEQAQSPEAAIASRVPSAYATALVGKVEPTSALVRAHLQMGMPVALRRAVEIGEGGPVSQLYLARALFESGRTYFRAQDFQDAQVILNSLLDSGRAQPKTDALSGTTTAETLALSAAQLDDARLMRALCVALMAGPKDAAALIAQGPRFADVLGNLALLDSLAEGQTELAGRAAFDAAYLRELVVQPGDPKAWSDLAARYSRAAKYLRGDEARWAKDRAKACKDIEKSVQAELSKK